MNQATNPLPARLQEIVEEFGYCEGREKIELLLAYAERLPELPEWLRDEHDTMDQVEECMTPVFVKASLQRWGYDLLFRCAAGISHRARFCGAYGRRAGRGDA